MSSKINMLIKHSTEVDIDVYANELFNTRFGKTYYPSLSALKNVLYSAMENDYIYVAEYNGNIIGFVWFSENSMFGKFPYLNLIFVFEQYRDLGVGKKLLDYFEMKVIEDFKSPSIKLFLVVKDDNDKAINFYKSNGYQPVGEINGLFRASKNEILMIKRINYKL